MFFHESFLSPATCDVLAHDSLCCAFVFLACYLTIDGNVRCPGVKSSSNVQSIARGHSIVERHLEGRIKDEVVAAFGTR